jgi:uncharacterized protein YcsI (UPF0317 family)
MPTTIYDASQVTKRRLARADSGDAAARQQQNLPIYAARLGVYDQSIVNTVRVGRMVEYQKRSGAILAFNGCPCAGIVDPSVQVQQQ